ncbi:MAG: hypothetical protein JWP30_621 [Homoserinimonas sp.]|nr:hypothetical protein [Homoserinimonas sp.]
MQGSPAAGRLPHWLLPLVRAVPALAIGLTITFLTDHSATVGLVAFGFFGLLSGIAIAGLGALTVADRVSRRVFVVQGVIAAASGAAAFIFAGAGLAVLLFIVTVFAALTGFLELYVGLRNRETQLGRDWLAVGAFTAVMALVFLLIPPDGAVLATGLIGAYGIMLGVFLVIAGLSLKWGQQDSTKGTVAA